MELKDGGLDWIILSYKKMEIGQHWSRFYDF